MGERPAAVNPADLKDAALRLLARREHSFSELTRKLTQRGWPPEAVETALSELAEAGLQSDSRYAESFARSRAQKAYGPMRIRAEMGQRGIDRSLIDQALRELDADWFSIAANWYERRYGSEPVSDIKEKSRRQQALARRGFSHEIVRELVA
jgi:regulatory protein